jgi:hypothetical protein
MHAEILPAVAELFAYAVASLGLAVAGIYVEYFAYTSFQSGHGTVATWAGILGLVIVGFGYLTATNDLTRAIAHLQYALGDE